MKSESEEVLSQLVDGEIVDPERLAAALAEPDAADILVEYARVHRAVVDDSGRPSEEFYDSMRRRLNAAPRRPVAVWHAPLAAAALVVLSLLGGMWIGWSALPSTTVSVPVVVRAPGTPPPATIALPLPTPIAMPPGCLAPGPPKPDRIVRLTVLSESLTRASAGGNNP